MRLRAVDRTRAEGYSPAKWEVRDCAQSGDVTSGDPVGRPFPATAMPDPEWWLALWPRPADVLGALGVEPGLEIAVDLCCGDGLFTVPLAALARQVVAIDLDPQLLAAARERTDAAGSSTCEFVEGDAYDLASLVRRPADIVLIANTFHGVPDKLRLTRTIQAVLRPGGRLLVVNWHKRPREDTTVLGQPRGPRTDLRMSPAEVEDVVASTGLRLVRVVELPPYHYGAIFGKPEPGP